MKTPPLRAEVREEFGKSDAWSFINDDGTLVCPPEKLFKFVDELITRVYTAALDDAKNAVPEAKEGLIELEDQEVDLDGRPAGEKYTYMTCKNCGGYDECDCSGFNRCRTETLAALETIINNKPTEGGEMG